MGNLMSGGAERLALVALSHVIQCKTTAMQSPSPLLPCSPPSPLPGRRAELMGLRSELIGAASAKAGGHKKMIARKDFDEAMASLHMEDSDQEVFDRLFTLFDKTGAGKVNYQELIVGLAPICNGTLNDRLILAFELADEEGKGHCTKDEMLFVFKAMNSTVNFLGDPTMDLALMEEMCESIFVSTQESESLTEAFEYAENVNAISEHPIFEQWLRAKDEELKQNS